MIKNRSVKILFICLIICYKINTQNSLQIGDKIPDIELGRIINYSKVKTKISDFNVKPLILYFWAPWCSPCIAGMPKLDSLQKKFSNTVNILLITKDSKEFAIRTLQTLQVIKK